MFMKQMKFLLVALMAVVMSVSVTSCMKGENESSYDLGIYATVVDNMTVTLLSDDGNVYYPENPAALKVSGETSYPKRVFAYLKYAECVTAASEKKIVTVLQSGSLYTRSLCTQPDTIKNDIPLAGLSEFVLVDTKQVLYTNVPAYCNLLFSLYIDDSAVIVDLVPVTASGNELTVKLQQTIGNKDASYTTSGYASFSIPSVSEINRVLAEIHKDSEEVPVLTSVGGKIKIKIIGEGKNQQAYTLSAKEVQIDN